MEKKLILSIILSILLVVALPFAYAGETETISLNELIENSQAYDGKVIQVQGEVLLEAMERDSSAWININDGTNAMGVYMPQESVQAIQHYGDYHTIGDTIHIEAVFNRSCKVHGGDMDLHFNKFIQITPGKVRVVPVIPYTIWIAIGLTLVTASIIVYYMKISGQFERVRQIIAYRRLNK